MLSTVSLNIYVTNVPNPELAANDICLKQGKVEVTRYSNRAVKVECAPGPMTGRFVIIQIRENFPTNLIICSVRIWGSSCLPYDNLAYQMNTTQSGENTMVKYPSSLSLLAVDGHHGVDEKDARRCAQTNASEFSHWWMVELKNVSAIYGLTIYGSLGTDEVLEIFVSRTYPSLTDGNAESQ